MCRLRWTAVILIVYCVCYTIGYVKKDDRIVKENCSGVPSPYDLKDTTDKSHSTSFRTTMLNKSFLPSTSTRTKRRHTTSQRAARALNVTGRPLQYIGIGYNLLRGNPDGNPHGSTDLDEGFLLDKRILQITSDSLGKPVEVEVHQFLPSYCKNDTTMFIGKKSYQQMQYNQYVFESVVFSPNNLTDSSFTLSPEFQQLYPKGSSDPPIYVDIRIKCATEDYMYNHFEVNNSSSSVTKEFATEVCHLPQTYDAAIYSKFLDSWGTAYVRDIGPTMGYSTSLLLDTGYYYWFPSSTPDEVGTLVSTTSYGSQHNPIPVRIGLWPITYALDPALWKRMNESGFLNRNCPSSFGLETIRKNVDTALQSYAANLLAPTILFSHPIVIPLTWPVGTYGLMKTREGCPGSKVYWAEGWRKQDTEDHNAGNQYPNDINSYIAGQFTPSLVVTGFCIKTTETTSQYDMSWQKGQYCLLQYKNCPSGFQSGYLYWDDEDDNNENAYGGTMPTGTYNQDTKIYYCCKTDGQASYPIYLPTDKPFILLRYGPMCQEVYHMDVKEISVTTDDEDTRNANSRWGTHPADDGSKDHMLHFCYYQPDAIAGVNSYVLHNIVG